MKQQVHNHLHYERIQDRLRQEWREQLKHRFDDEDENDDGFMFVPHRPIIQCLKQQKWSFQKSQYRHHHHITISESIVFRSRILRRRQGNRVSSDRRKHSQTCRRSDGVSMFSLPHQVFIDGTIIDDDDDDDGDGDDDDSYGGHGDGDCDGDMVLRGIPRHKERMNNVLRPICQGISTALNVSKHKQGPRSRRGTESVVGISDAFSVRIFISTAMV